MLSPIISEPLGLPITLAQVKAQSIVDFVDDDVLLEFYLRAAVAHFDGTSGILNIALFPRDVVQSLPDFSCLRIPFGPVSSVTSISYFDEAGAAQALTGWRLLEDANSAYIYFDGTFPALSPRPDAVSISYVAGFSEGVPADLVQAISMLAATWYENREATTTDGKPVGKIPFGVNHLVAKYRRVGV